MLPTVELNVAYKYIPLFSCNEENVNIKVGWALLSIRLAWALGEVAKNIAFLLFQVVTKSNKNKVR